MSIITAADVTGSPYISDLVFVPNHKSIDPFNVITSYYLADGQCQLLYCLILHTVC